MYGTAVRRGVEEPALRRWIGWAPRCRIPEFVALQRTIVEHTDSILAAIEHGLSNGRIESVNTKVRLITRVGFGFRTPAALIALAMLALGGRLPRLLGRNHPQKSQSSHSLDAVPGPVVTCRRQVHCQKHIEVTPPQLLLQSRPNLVVKENSRETYEPVETRLVEACISSASPNVVTASRHSLGIHRKWRREDLGGVGAMTDLPVRQHRSCRSASAEQVAQGRRGDLGQRRGEVPPRGGGHGDDAGHDQHR